MSSVRVGTNREMRVGAMLAELDYCWCKVSRSGQVRAGDRDKRILADLIAFSGRARLPHLVVSCGGIGKRVGAAFRELDALPLPAGFRPLVARCVRRHWFFYADCDSRHDNLEDALAAACDA